MNRNVLAAVVVIAVIAAATIARIANTPRPAVGRGDFDRLRSGLSRAEVEAILHGPPRNDLTDQALVWMPQGDGGKTSARFEPASPALEFFVKEDRAKGAGTGPFASPADDFFPGAEAGRGGQGVWASPAGLVAVLYDREGRLADRYFSTVDLAKTPTLGGWLASRPAAIRRSLGL